MKSVLTITALILILSLNNFSQERVHKKVLPERLISGEIQKVNTSFVDSLDVFNSKDSRTIINKTSLANGFLLIEEVSQLWIPIIGDWGPDSYKTSYTYDANNNLTEVLRRNWDGSVWVNFNKNSFIYDANNNQTEILSQTWNISTWKNNFKYSYNYDGNNNRTEEVYQIWEITVWSNIHKFLYAYDGNNNRIESLVQSWSNTGGTFIWTNSLKYSYTFDGNNNRKKNFSKLGMVFLG